MPDTVSLSEALDDLRVPGEITREWFYDTFLAAIQVERDSLLAEACEDVFVAKSGDTDASLQMRPGGWRVSVAGTTARTLLASALVAGGLAAGGFADIPAELIPAVLPMLVDVERVRLDRRERALLVPFRAATSGVEGRALHPQVVYSRLDDGVKDQLNYLDFVSFCDRLIAAGELDDAGYDEIRPRSSGDPAWIRITSL